jgi:leader peptidase (prepilin peptidase)/N-methyltransferase
MDMSRGVNALIAFAFGACVGSFVNVVAYRLPRDISIVTPRSFCPECRRPVRAWANLPIIAYLMLRGRCTGCGGAIPFRYFLTELALAAAAAYLYLNFAPLDAFARFVLCAALFAVALIDYDWRVIPNVITFPGIPLGVLAAWLMIAEVGWRSSLTGVAIGAGFLFATGEAYMRIRGKEGVGMGDVWLIGMAGAFLGLPGVLFTLFGGSVLGIVGAIAFALSGGAPGPPDEQVPAAVAGATAARVQESATSFWQMPIPFGPFLALAAAIFALFQPALTDWLLAH